MKPGRRGGPGRHGLVVRAAGALVALLVAGPLVGGCSTPPVTSTARDGSAAAPVSEAVATPVSAPEPPTTGQTGMSVRIDRIGASSSLLAMGLNADRTIQVPPLDQVEQAGWYSRGPAPGDRGPAVVMGHVNGNGRTGVFARLHELRQGDTVTVTRAGRDLTFTVDRIQTVDKGSFPTREVYSDRPGPELRLITCGGPLDRTARSYVSNVIVYATLTT